MIDMQETSSNVIPFYAVKDQSLDTFAFPFSARSDREAAFMVRNAIDSGSVLHRFPDHFTLYKVGEFNDRTGVFSEFRPVIVCEIRSLVNSVDFEEVENECSSGE